MAPDELSSRLISKLSSIQFAGSGERGVKREAKEVASSYIASLWQSGDLPLQVGKQWIVGYDCHVTFFACFVRPICVGPAKPSKFRDRYVSSSASTKI